MMYNHTLPLTGIGYRIETERQLAIRHLLLARFNNQRGFSETAQRHRNLASRALNRALATLKRHRYNCSMIVGA